MAIPACRKMIGGTHITVRLSKRVPGSLTGVAQGAKNVELKLDRKSQEINNDHAASRTGHKCLFSAPRRSLSARVLECRAVHFWR